jgi:hypothetical protein
MAGKIENWERMKDKINRVNGVKGHALPKMVCNKTRRKKQKYERDN